MYEIDLRDLTENETSLVLMQEIYRSSKYPPHMRLRAALAAMPFEHPKLTVNANVNSNFADRMEEIARLTGKSNVIDARPIPQLTDPSRDE
jgi:hypothetical protein